jgi:hypothetical protein
MANTFKDLSDGDILREYLAEFHNSMTLLKACNRQHDSQFGQKGQKNGGEILIRNPNQFTVRTGAVQDVQPITESTQTLTVANEYGIDVDWSTVEDTMSIENFRKSVVKPQMMQLAATVEYTIMQDFYKKIFNYVGTPGTALASLLAVMNGHARLKDCLAPDDDLHIIMEPTAMAATINAMGAYFHPASSLDQAMTRGYMGYAGGLKWWESATLPSHTNGSRVDASHVMDVSTITNGDETITTTGQTSTTGALKEGDVFTIDAVYAVNLETKAVYPYLQQFVVTADMDCDQTDVIAISPAIYKDGAKQNVYHATWTGSEAIVHVAAGGSGAASTAYRQPIAFHRDALTVAFANLTKPYSGMSERVTMDGVSMRLWKQSDIVNDKHSARLDVLCGWLAQRPYWATRVRG